MTHLDSSGCICILYEGASFTTFNKEFSPSVVYPSLGMLDSGIYVAVIAAESDVSKKGQ